MIRTLRAFFLSRVLREKLLLVAFILLGVLMWLSSFSRRSGAFWQQQRITTSTLEDQKQWLKNRQSIEDFERKAAGSLDASKTLQATQLFAEVERLGREAGLNPTLGDPRDDSSGLFPVHTLQVSVTKADFDQISKFYYALQARSPYISIEQFIIRVTPPTHTLSLRVSSVEISK